MPMSPRLMRPKKPGGLPGEGVHVTFTTDIAIYDTNLSAKSTTGYVKVVTPDDQHTVALGDGNSAAAITYSYESQAGQTKVYPCDAAGVVSGALTELNISEYGLVAVGTSGANSLASLSVSTYMEGTFTVSGGSQSLATLAIGGTFLTGVSISNLPLTTLNLSSLNVTSLDVSEWTSLTTLTLYAMPLTTITGLTSLTSLTSLTLHDLQLGSLNVSGLGSLVSVNATYCAVLTSLNFNGCVNLTGFTLTGCPAVAEISAAGVSLGGAIGSLTHHGQMYNYTAGALLIGANMGGEALDDFYNSLEPGNGIIVVSGNPGTGEDSPAIATAKGYTVYGS